MKSIYCLAVLLVASCATASDNVTVEPNLNSYNYVSQYKVEIEARDRDVWAYLIDLPSWMYELDLSLVSGIPKNQGEVRRLYEGQNFFIQITKIIPNELLVIANLPSTFNGESSTGIAVITLNEVEGKTTVRLVMSRRYTWDDEGESPQKALRESQEFAERTRAMWKGRFLEKLRELAEFQ